jgi:protein-S-isoprenylcysteine O-methyltransferase Ste14
MVKNRFGGILALIAGRGSILVFFIMAFEVMIMISPFAFFFYSVFNPVFKWLNQYAATKWLTSFFLPHMIFPPTPFLQAIRVAGSIFFVVGAFSFIVCALQVYLGKIFRRGIASKGLYNYIRHPQYLSLGIWGIGMSILWPRFIVLASLSLMFVLYYFLAKDEERRMLKQYGGSYRQYMDNTGMFFPRFVERRVAVPAGFVTIPVMIIAAVLGAGSALRAVTLNSLWLSPKNNITLVSMLPEDNAMIASVVKGIVKAQAAGKLIYLRDDKDYLGYLMSSDYIMQGMIADTSGEFHLYKQHHTVTMISDWVLHPFQHLRTSPAFHMAKMHNVDPAAARRHHCPLGINDPGWTCETCPYRRVILVEVTSDYGKRLSGTELLSFSTTRTPVYSIDINTKTGEILNVKKVGRTTAWKDVPTPAI